MSESSTNLSVAQLRAILKEHHVKNISGLRKAQLLDLVAAIPNAAAAAPAPAQADVDNKQAAGLKIKKKADTGKKSAAGKAQVAAAAGPVPVQEGASLRERQRPARQEEHKDGGSFRQRGDYQERQTQDRSQDRYQDRQSQQRGTYPKNKRNVRGRWPAPLQQEGENPALRELDSGQMANGILEVLPEGYGFIRCENYLPGENDVYVSRTQIHRFHLKTGDIISGNIKVKSEKEKYSALLFVKSVNGFSPAEAQKRCNFEDMIPIFPNQRYDLETEDSPIAMRIVNLISPIGRGQRGMIVSPPKVGKTTLLKQIAMALHTNYPQINIIILLIDERPEEVTDIKEFIEGDNVEVIYSTFDELPEHHERVSEMVLERAKRLVEHRKDVVILLDSITRLARACNLTVQPSGRTLTGGLDPAALYMPKRFFGSARCMRGGGSLTVLATALVETGSKMDDVVFEEFKGTGNMELVLDRRLAEKRIFPAINISKSSTRREDLLLSPEELETMFAMRRALSGMKSEEALEKILDLFKKTKNNAEYIRMLRHVKIL